MRPSNPILLVHGFQYDPDAEGRDNPHNHTFPRWEEMLGDVPTVRHAWFSVPLTRRNVWRSWRHGRWNRYRWAWDLAHDEALRVANRLRGFAEPADIVCHSLGSRVVVEALSLGAPAARVLFLNGAEYLDAAARVARRRSEIGFFSVSVATDDVLNKLGRFAPGFGGEFVGNTPLGLLASLNWTDLPLDDANFQGTMRELYGWDLAGDNPESVGDHWYSFEHEENWPLYRAILDRSWPTLGGDDA